MRLLSRKSTGSSYVAPEADFVPARILEVELGQPLPNIFAINEQTGQRYRRIRCVVRLHTQPLGVVEFSLDQDELYAAEYAPYVWDTLGTKINEHLRQDGLAPVGELDAAGLSGLTVPQCIEERERFLAGAPFVSVIVATRDRPERIPNCLRSLLALHYPRYEIIIVDNAPSTSATADLIQQCYCGMPQVRYLREDQPGVSRAANLGLQAARGEIVAFTDDDVVVDPYWLTGLVRGFSLAGNVACVTGPVLPVELETQAQAWYGEYGDATQKFTRRIFDMKRYRQKTMLYPYAGSFGQGASMAFTAAFLRSVGGFDPALGPGSLGRSGQDNAVFFQVIIRGYQLVYEPASLAYHFEHRDYKSLRKQMYNYGIGYTAFLTKSMFDDPRLLLDFVPKVPYGLLRFLSPWSSKNTKKLTNYPRELISLELRGMFYGPFAYLRSRKSLRASHKAFVPGESSTTLSQ